MTRRFQWGCGQTVTAGWVNSDRDDHGQDHVGDIRNGLPFDDAEFDVVVSHHALQMLSWPELVPALAELRRVTTRRGWLRLSVPDLLAAVYAYETGAAGHFQIDDANEKTLDGKICLYLSQGGGTRSVFTYGWLDELLDRAGWVNPQRVRYGVTSSPWPDITSLDSRPDESIFVEATA